MAEFAPKIKIRPGVLPTACVKAAASAMAAVPTCAASAMVIARITPLFVRPVACRQFPLPQLLLLLLPLLALATALSLSADSRLTEAVNACHGCNIY